MEYEPSLSVTAGFSSLTPVELAVVALVVASIQGSEAHVDDARAALRERGFAPWTIAAIERAPGWPVTDDDRLDVIVSTAARWTRDRRSVSELELERLRAVGLTTADILDLAHAVSCAETVPH